MGKRSTRKGNRTSRKHAGSKGTKYHRKYTYSTHARECGNRKDMDQIFDQVEATVQETGNEIGNLAPLDKFVAVNEDLPGAGQFYCVETARYFADADSLAKHKKTKTFKRIVKELKTGKKYTQDDAEFYAGITKEKLPSASSIRQDEPEKIKMDE